MNRCARTLLLAAVAWMLLPAFGAHAQEPAGVWPPERRKDQFPRDASYLVLPLPYSLPGIGSGVDLLAYEVNNFGFYHQTYLVQLTGDAQGTILGLSQVMLIEKRLLLDVEYLGLSKGTVNNYTLRGMNTGKNDFTLLETNDYTEYFGQLTLTTDDRRWAAYAIADQQQLQLVRIRDSNGNPMAEFSPPQHHYGTQQTAGAVMDLTDDRQDPRQGVRLQLSATQNPRQSPEQPDFYITNASASAYVHVGRQSTVAFNYYRSDAQVTHAGETDPNVLAQQQNLSCKPGDVQCQAALPFVLESLVHNAQAANRNGTAEALGGQNRMRAYPQGRFQGAHMEYFAVELRANLTDEFTPFDYKFFKGVRTGVQVAPFYETGTVAESEGGLWSKYREDYGVGLRIFTAGGALYRIDVAVGDEGTNTTIIVNYPW